MTTPRVPASLPGLTCDDLFTGEIASTGYTCAEYEDNRWCTKSGNEGPGWDASWGALDQGVSASCCACGKAAEAAGATNARVSCPAAVCPHPSTALQCLSANPFPRFPAQMIQGIPIVMPTQAMVTANARRVPAGTAWSTISGWKCTKDRGGYSTLAQAKTACSTSSECAGIGGSGRQGVPT